jgi:DNA polymerase-3 subunit epsilon
MILSAIDFETSGTDPAKHRVTEIGAVLWDTATSSPLRVEGFIVNPGDDCEWDDKAIEVTGITPQIAAEQGIDSDEALSRLLYMIERGGAVCGHNCREFDEPMLAAWCKRAGAPMPEKLWIDTLTDVEYPTSMKTRQLTHLAAEHFILNFFGHRAVFDVMTMLKVLSCYDFERVHFLAQQPIVRVMANVSFKDKDLAKARGYGWKMPFVGAKKEVWLKNLKKCFLEQEIKEAGFPVVVLDKV